MTTARIRVEIPTAIGLFCRRRTRTVQVSMANATPDSSARANPPALGDAEHLHRGVVHVPAEHEERAMGEVQHPAHAEDHRKTHRDQRVQAAQREPLDDDLTHGPTSDRWRFGTMGGGVVPPVGTSPRTGGASPRTGRA